MLLGRLHHSPLALTPDGVRRVRLVNDAVEGEDVLDEKRRVRDVIVVRWCVADFRCCWALQCGSSVGMMGRHVAGGLRAEVHVAVRVQVQSATVPVYREGRVTASRRRSLIARRHRGEQIRLCLLVVLEKFSKEPDYFPKR